MFDKAKFEKDVNKFMTETTTKLLDDFNRKREELKNKGIEVSEEEIAAVEKLAAFTSSEEFRKNLIEEILKGN